jgi:hypothetical protein
MSPISLGLDLEVICKDPRFFKILTNRWPGRVCVLICHDDKEGVARSLENSGIRFDYILPVHSHDQLLKAICENGIAYYYQCDDIIIELPQSLKVFRMHTAWEDVEKREGLSKYSIYIPSLDDQPAAQPHSDDPSQSSSDQEQSRRDLQRQECEQEGIPPKASSVPPNSTKGID